MGGTKGSPGRGSISSDIEARVKRIEDREAMQDVLNSFCNAVDSLSDLDAVVACFADEAVLDLSGINLPKLVGLPAIRGFFAQVFIDMSHHAHLSGNFSVDKHDKTAAACRATVLGAGAGFDGRTVLVYVRYHLNFVLNHQGWKIAKLRESALMPLPSFLAELQARD